MSDFQGTAREFGGRVQQKVGEFAGDAKTQADGSTTRPPDRPSNRSRSSAT